MVERSPGAAQGNSTARISSSSARAVANSPVKKLAAGMVRSPFGPTATMRASSATQQAGSSAAASA